MQLDNTRKLLFEICEQDGLDPDEDFITPAAKIVTALNILLDYYEKIYHTNLKNDISSLNHDLPDINDKIELTADLAFAEAIKLNKNMATLFQANMMG